MEVIFGLICLWMFFVLVVASFLATDDPQTAIEYIKEDSGFNAVSGAFTDADDNARVLHLYRTGKITRAEFERQYRKIGKD